MTLIEKSVGEQGKNRLSDVAKIQYILSTFICLSTAEPYLPNVIIDGIVNRDLIDAISLAIADHGSDQEKEHIQGGGPVRLQADSQVVAKLHSFLPDDMRDIRALGDSEMLFIVQPDSPPEHSVN